MDSPTNAEEIVLPIPLELRQIIYTHLVLRLRAEKRFSLLAYMNASHAFRTFSICNVLQKIWNETKMCTRLKLVNETYEAVSTVADDFIMEMSLTAEKDSNVDGATNAMADAFTRILYTFFSLGKLSPGELSSDELSSGELDPVVRVTPMANNKTRLSVMSSDRMIFALININEWVCNKHYNWVKKDKTIGLKISNIDLMFPHTITHIHLQTDVNILDGIDLPIDDAISDLVSIEDQSFDEIDSDSDSDGEPNYTSNHFKGKIPTYTFSKTYDRIIACGYDRYFANATSGLITRTDCVFSTSQMPVPRTEFNVQIVMQIDHLIRLYETCTKNNDVIIIENNNANGFTMSNTHNDLASFEGAFNEPLGDFHVKISSEWIQHILPMMNIIIGCSFYIKPDFPIVVRLTVKYSQLSDL